MMEQSVPSSRVRAVLKALPVYPTLRRIYQFGARDEEWARVVMNRETQALIASLSPGDLRALEISGANWQDMPFRSYRSVHYPECDICESSLDDRFDLILADQVFEHLLWPYRAARNVYKMLNPHGYFLVTTPFLVRVHNMPTDCSRWTEVGIKHFLAECGFSLEQIQTGSWGNRACVRANLSHWSMYRPWLHSLKNEPAFPMVVWALARK
jgi:hypothetical protein